MIELTKLIVLVVLFSGLGPASAEATDGKMSEQLQELVSAYADHRDFSGAVAVFHQGQIIYEGAFGLAVREWEVSNDLQTRFLIASVTKPITAALIMRLADSGRLAPEDPITKHLSSYRSDTGDRITIHHLLTHSSGLPNYAVWPAFWDENPSRMKYTKEEFVKRFCSGDLLFSPGSESRYSDANYYLLALIAEHASGLAWPQALAHWVLEPLGMSNSGVIVESAVISRRAQGYLLRGDTYSTPPYINYEHTQMGAGDMFSSVGDLLRFERGLSAGDFLKPESRDRVFEAHVPSIFSGFADAWTSYGWNLGVETLRESGRELQIIHAPGNNAGFTTVILRFPESHTSIVIAENVGPGPLDMGVYEMGREIIHAIHGETYRTPRPSIVGPLSRVLQEQGISSADATYHDMKEAGTYDLDSRGMNRLGYQFLAEGKLQAAVAVFQWNIESHPANGNAHDSLGEALVALGETARAIASYQKALELDPESKSARRALEELSVDRR